MMSKKRSAEKTVRDIRRATRRHYSAEEKIRIVLEGLRGEDSIAVIFNYQNVHFDPVFGTLKAPYKCFVTVS